MVQVYNSYHPTSIYQTPLDIEDDYRHKCINEIYRLGDSMNYSTNVKALMTSFKIFEESEVFNNLFDSIWSKINICPWIISKKPPLSFQLTGAWGAIYKENEKTIPHSHGNSLVSFIYYLQTDDNSSPLKIHTSPEILIYPKINDLIMFRGYVEHSVPPQPEVINNDRIVLAGNLI